MAAGRGGRGFRGGRWFVCLVALASNGSGLVVAQPVRLKGRIEPYVGSLGRDYPVVGLAFRARRPDTLARAPYAREVHLGGGVTWQGGVRTAAHFRAPELAGGWRLAVTAAATRKTRFFFPGVGNDAEFDRDLEKRSRPDFYSVRRNRAAGRVEVTKWMTTRIGAAIGAGVDDASFTAFPAPSAFGDRYGSSLRETDLSVAAIVLYDSRDREAIAAKGALLQAGIQFGGGAGRYHRTFGAVQGYLALGNGTVLALRAAVSQLSHDAPLIARFEIPTWDHELPVFGGDNSHRGLAGGRLIGAGVALANAEIRQDLGTVRRQTVTLIGFVDAGRVFEGDQVRLTSDGLKASSGLGLALRGRRERLGAALAAIGPDGLRLSLLSGWPF